MRGFEGPDRFRRSDAEPYDPGAVYPTTPANPWANIGRSMSDYKKSDATLVPDKDKENKEPKEEDIVYNYDEAMEKTGHGAFNKFAFVACSFIYTHAVLQILAPLYVTGISQCALNMTILQKRFLEVAGYIGMSLASHAWGMASDHFGRRKIIQIACVGSLIMSLTSSFSTSFMGFMTARVLTGSLVSGQYSTVLVYLGELTNKRHRDGVISWTLAVGAFALTCISIIAWIVIPTDEDGTSEYIEGELADSVANSWRIFIWIWELCGIIGFILVCFLPESPSYTFATLGPFRTLPVLTKIYNGNNIMKKKSTYPVQKLKITTDLLRNPKEYGFANSFRDHFQFFKKPLKKCIFVSHVTTFIVYIVPVTIYLRIPKIYMAVSQNINANTGICSILINEEVRKITSVAKSNVTKNACTVHDLNLSIYKWMIIMTIINFIPFVIFIYVLSMCARWKLYACAIAPSVIFILIGAAVPHALSAAILVTVALISTCCHNIITLFVIDCAPTTLRASSSGAMHSTGALGAVLGTVILPLTFPSVIGCVTYFVVMTCMAIGSIILLKIWWPDVKSIRATMEKKKFTY